MQSKMEAYCIINKRNHSSKYMQVITLLINHITYYKTAVQKVSSSKQQHPLSAAVAAAAAQKQTKVIRAVCTTKAGRPCKPAPNQ